MYPGRSCGPVRLLCLQRETKHRDAKRELELENGRGAAAAEETGEQTDDGAQKSAKNRQEEVENRGDKTGEHAANNVSVLRTKQIETDDILEKLENGQDAGALAARGIDITEGAHNEL